MARHILWGACQGYICSQTARSTGRMIVLLLLLLMLMLMLMLADGGVSRRVYGRARA